MRALVTGFVLDVKPIEIGPLDNRRPARELSIQTDKAQIDRVRLDPAKFLGDVPREGEHVVLSCWFSAWTGRNGAGLSVTAQEHADVSTLVPASV